MRIRQQNPGAKDYLWQEDSGGDQEEGEHKCSNVN
jgi:hypothetical protein